MKRIIILLLTFITSLSLVGCNKSTTKSQSETTTKGTISNSSTTSSKTTTGSTIEGGYYLDNFPLKTFATDTISVSKIKSYYSSYDWSDINTLSQTALITKVKNLLKSTATKLSSQTYKGLSKTFLSADAVPGNTTKMRLFYSHDIVNAKYSGGGWNREHVYAKSVGGYTEDDTPSQDLHDMRPTYTQVNSTRGNSPFGLVSNRESYKVMSDRNNLVSGYKNGNVFEPIDEVKGDVARCIFYICVMYYNEYQIDILKMIATRDVNLFLKWNREDPVDEYEIFRNNVVQGIQGNRNIFIDFPSIADEIWG